MNENNCIMNTNEHWGSVTLFLFLIEVKSATFVCVTFPYLFFFNVMRYNGTTASKNDSIPK